MADKFLRNNAGTITEKEATVVSAGPGDAGEIPALDATGRLDATVMPVGIGADTNQIQASEALSAGDFVNVHSVAGAFRVRKADAATSGKYADGFVLAAVASGAVATVYSEGHNTAVTAVTPGIKYLSDVTPGGWVDVAPAGTGEVVQRIGIGVSTTGINFEPQQPVVLA